MARVFNFSAGPSVLPEVVLKQAADEMLDYKGSGMSVMEMSHRSKVYDNIIKEAEKDLRDLMDIPDNYKVLFLQGGASQQFAAFPMNLMKNGVADYIITGQWAKKAEDRSWLLVNKFELNDKLYANGDFKKTWKHKNGIMPIGFWLTQKAKYLPTAGENVTPALLVNHDSRLVINMKVEAEKKYELEFEVKAATPDLLK